MHTDIAGHVEKKHKNSTNCIHMIYGTYVYYSKSVKSVKSTKICHKCSVGKKYYRLHHLLKRILILSWWTFSDKKNRVGI